MNWLIVYKVNSMKWIAVFVFYAIYLPAHSYFFSCLMFSRCGVSGDMGWLSVMLKCYFSVVFVFFLITSIKYRLSVHRVMNTATLVFVVSILIVLFSVSFSLKERLY